MSINLSSLEDGFRPSLQSTENALTSQIKAAGENPTQEDLLKMQSGMERWALLTQIESTVTKVVGDALKGIIQKIN